LLNLIETRHKLHQLAEISSKEFKTAQFISQIINSYNPSRLTTNIAGTGILAEFKFSDHGPQILFRADLDALPIAETIDINYHSLDSQCSHKCGHDGHMTVLLSLLNHLSLFKRGSLFLFFQPAEETGVGAYQSLHDDILKNYHFDQVFSFHNIPGLELGEVILCPQNFSMASRGLKILLQGKSSHAAEPQHAVSSFPLANQLSQQILSFNHLQTDENFKLATLTYFKMGEDSFGITPGTTEMNITLRAYHDQSIEWMQEQITQSLKQSHDIKTNLTIHDDFPATTNNPQVVLILEEIFKRNNITYHLQHFPFKWSEDFGHFTKKYSGVYLGIGSGTDCYQLHQPEYDFPDALLPKAETIYQAIAQHFLAN
jgi:amidohydrolase